MKSLVKRFIEDDNGATSIEYSLIAALLVVVLIGVGAVLGPALSDVFTGSDKSVGAAINKAIGSS